MSNNSPRFCIKDERLITRRSVILLTGVVALNALSDDLAINVNLRTSFPISLENSLRVWARYNFFHLKFSKSKSLTIAWKLIESRIKIHRKEGHSHQQSQSPMKEWQYIAQILHPAKLTQCQWFVACACSVLGKLSCNNILQALSATVLYIAPPPIEPVSESDGIA